MYPIFDICLYISYRLTDPTYFYLLVTLYVSIFWIVSLRICITKMILFDKRVGIYAQCMIYNPKHQIYCWSSYSKLTIFSSGTNNNNCIFIALTETTCHIPITSSLWSILVPSICHLIETESIINYHYQ